MKRFLQRRRDRRANDQLQASVDLADSFIEALQIPTSRPEYPYKPINDDHHIRLLLLHTEHAAVDRQVRGSLVVKPLEAVKDKYDAISYVWGGEKLSKSIVIEEGGGEFDIMITENLYAALTEIAIVKKKIKKNVFVWADGICINQKDANENPQQVLLMKHIYSSAEAVWVHFGLDRDELDAIGKAATRLHSKLSTNEIKEAVRRRPIRAKQHFLKAGSLEERALEKLWDHAWWRRCWTLEEAILAKNLIFTIGEDMYDLRPLARLIFESGRAGGGLPNDLDGSLLQRFVYVGDESFNAGQSSLLELIWSTRFVEAYDERDLLYALLGIAKEGKSAELAPNYKEDLDKVRLRYAKFLITNGDGRELLHLCFDKAQAGKLPSWVPQRIESFYSEEGMRVQELVPAEGWPIFYSKEERPIQDAISDKRRISSVRIIDDAENILRLEGFRLGVIADLRGEPEDGRTVNVQLSLPTQLRKIETWCRDLRDLILPTGGDAHLLRILLTTHDYFWNSKMDWIHDDKELRDFHRFLHWSWENLWCLDDPFLPPAPKTKDALLLKRVEIFYAAAATHLHSRRLCLTEDYMPGLADLTARIGDILFTLDRKNLLVLRPMDSVGKYEECYRIIGPATLCYSEERPLRINREMEHIYVI